MSKCFLHEGTVGATHICADCMEKRGFKHTTVAMQLFGSGYQIELISRATGKPWNGHKYNLLAGDGLRLDEVVEDSRVFGDAIRHGDWYGPCPYGPDTQQAPDTLRQGLPRKIRHW